ncbi:MAG: hypothetical protein AAB599_01375 [Patescibacteria group bacterium]
MFFAFFLVSEVIYLFLSFKAKEVGMLDLHNDKHMFLIIGSLAILFVAYFFSYQRLEWGKVSAFRLIAASIILNLTLLFAPLFLSAEHLFISSNDIYSYIFTGRVFSIFGENPYFVTYDSFTHDILYAKLETIWAHHTVLYGPLFIYLGALVNLIGQNNLFLLSLIFKSVLVGANIGAVYLLWKLTKSKRAVFLYGLNPLVIFELSGNGHTESLIIFLLLVSIWLLKKVYIGSFIVFVASILIKYYTAIFLPFWLISLKKQGWRKLVSACVVGGAFVVLAYLPLWGGFSTFDYLVSFYNGQYVSPALGIYVGEILLGSYALSFQINTMIFILVSLVVFWKFYCSAGGIRELIFGLLILYWVYLLTKTSLVLYWYFIPLIFLGAICTSFKEYRKVGIGAVVFSSVYSLTLYYFLR